MPLERLAVPEAPKEPAGTTVPAADRRSHGRDRQPRVPPLSADLLAAVSRVGPVATRRPKVTCAGVLLISLGWAGVLLQPVMGVRSDLRELPVLPLALYVAISLTVFAAHLALALVPASGGVLPSAFESARASAMLMLITVPLGLFFAANVAITWPAVRPASALWHGALACWANGLAVAVVPAVLGLAVLRRVVPGGAWRTAFAVGAGSGVLAGAVSQLHCPNGGVAHLVLGHGLAMVLPALLLVVQQRLR